MIKETILSLAVLWPSISLCQNLPDSMDQRKCLALNIYHESRSESEPGQFAVAEVTMRRVDSDKWPNTICEVVFQSLQFSWTIYNPNVYEKDAWEKAMKIAEISISRRTNLTKCADHYARYDIKPEWSKTMSIEMKIGNHVFYCSE